MKINWKVLVACVVIVGAIVWGVGSLRPHSYSGTDLNFGLGSGPVTVTNPSNEPIPVQLVSTRAGTFTISSSIEGVEGRSTRQGSGSSSTNWLEFELPPGISTFTVVRGVDINLVANADASLEATVQPLNAADARTTLIVTVVAIIGSLFYLSHSNNHRWVSASRRKKALDQAAAQEIERQNFKRMFGRVTSSKS